MCSAWLYSINERASQGNHGRDCGYGKKGGWGEGFEDTDLGAIQKLTDITPEELTEDDLVDVSAFKPVPEDEEEDVVEAVQENKWLLDDLAEWFQLFKTAFVFFYDMDPSMYGLWN